MIEDQFTFEADAEAKGFALGLARTMVRLFDISLSEAIGRINKHWNGQKLFGPLMIYHLEPDELARTIYYVDGTFWWVEEWMAEHTPKPKPYP
jgi:hypothetical protein